MNDRHKNILKILSESRKITVNHLSEVLSVSQATIRHDLTILEDKQLLKRIHGGAILDEQSDKSHTIGVNYDVNFSIVDQAMMQVDENETVFINSGPINAILAREIIKKRKATTIVTNSSFIARQAGNHTIGRVILIGGIYIPDNESLTGKMAIEALNKINFSKSFIEVDGFSKEIGFTEKSMMSADMNSEIIKRSPNTFVLVNSNVFGKINLSKVCEVNDIDYLITDSITNSLLSFFKVNNVKVLA